MYVPQPMGPFRPPVRGSRHAVLLLVMVALACASCASAGTSPSPSSSVSLHAPSALAASVWEQVSLPAPNADMRGVAVSPADPATLFACTADLQASESSGSGVTIQPMMLWRTTDAGARWTRYTPELAAGAQCLFSIAPDDPRRVTLQLTQVGQAQPCAGDTFYLSADGGATWRQLPPHSSIAPSHANGWCDLHVTQHHLFLAYSFEPSSQAPQISLLERSDDDGASWARADRGLGNDALFLMPAIGPGDTLAVTLFHVRAHPEIAGAELWTSVDAGQTWRQVSTLPDGAGTFLLTSEPPHGNAWPTPDHPFYALVSEQIPSDLYREQALMSPDERDWTLLPPLPVSGVSQERRGILQALGVLPDGRLAVWGTDPASGLPAPNAIKEPMSAFWLWLWDPTAQRWQVLPSPLAASASEGCGLCWQAQPAVSRDGALYLYLTYFDLGIPGTTLPGMFRVRIPAAM
jgi:photosystem II stability/assembly factor-like uncharacterized protein